MAFTSFIIACLLSLISQSKLTSAQNCYYPDGSLSTEGVAACSSQGGACCPLNWQCMSNGLCYLENEGYYGRYSCTDRTWQSPHCPQFCKAGVSAAGNEAVLWCSNGDFCCDGDRVSFNCCNKADAVRFSLSNPSPIAFISTTPSVSPVSSYAGNSPAASSSSVPDVTTTQSSSAPASTTSSQMSTITSESITTGTNGQMSTVTQLVTVGPAGAEATRTSKPKHDNKPSSTAMIIGLAAGLPVFLIIAGILLFFFIRHMRKSNGLHQPRNPSADIGEIDYKPIPPGTHAYEADGSPVAPGRTKSGRTSELYGSDVNLHSPNLSVSTSTSGLPRYSPLSPNRTKSTPGIASINEEPTELWSGPVYRPYRPPPGHPLGAAGESGDAP